MRLKFKQWIQLDDVRKKIEKETEEGKWQKIPDLIFQFIFLCGYEIDDPPWMEVQKIYVQAVSENQPRIAFPLFRSKEKGKDTAWDYEERSWYFWLNLFARTYGWTVEDVEDLDLDDVMGLYQEILVDEQMEKEWEWGLSEMAYPYNKSTKKQHFKPLSRPDWMVIHPSNQPVKKVKIPIKALPVGVIINLDEM